MGIDTKPNLNNDRFEQFPDGRLDLSGCTHIHGGFLIESGATLSIKTGAGTGKVLVSNSEGVVSWGVSGDAVKKSINLSSHGLSIQDIVGFSGGTYNKPIANGTYDGEILGIVSSVPNVNTFELTQAGYISGLTGLIQSTTYFLSDGTAGLLTSTQPTGDTHISKAMLLADSTTSGWVLPYAGYVITTGDTGGGTWGTITGTISDQSDLQNALDEKADYSTVTASTIYNLNSPATCSIGGVSVGYVLTGKSIQCIIQDAFAPYIAPTFSAFNIAGTYPIEVGTALSGSKSFTWTTTTSANVTSNSIGISEVGGSLLASGLANSSSASVNIGTKTNSSPTTWTWRITGCSTQNNSFQRDVSKCSIYPIYYGKLTSGSRPEVTNSLVTTGCTAKSVVNSTGTVTVSFNSSSSEYTWLAIPATSTSKTCWYVTALDNGRVNNAPSDKYPDECIIAITSAESCWSSINYKVYMSGAVGAISASMEFRNS